MHDMAQEITAAPLPVTPRPRARPCRDYVEQQRALMAKQMAGEGPQLWRQMMIGFLCAALLGLIMFVLGAVFISKALEKKESITIMLCIMGIACGLIIIAGVGVLGKLLISRKHQSCQGRRSQQQHPQSACFHTCSVIYTPSQDPLPYVCDPPPAYDTVVSLALFPHGQQGAGEGSAAEDSDAENSQSVMVLPPKYDDVTKPIPPYHDAILS